MKEVWKDIPNLGGEYQASNMGRIRSIKNFINKRKGTEHTRVKVLTQHNNRRGYPMVQISYRTINKSFFVHRLVALAFLPNLQDLEQVNHKDENKQNNCVENLEWCTNDYNCHYGTHIERIAKSMEKAILQISLNGEVINRFPSIKEASKITGICKSHITECARNKTSRHTAGGYIWKYANNIV